MNARRPIDRSVRYLILAIILIIGGCKKEDDDAGTTVNTGGGSSPFELHLQLDGGDVHHVEGASNFIFVPGAQGDCNIGLTICTSYQESVVSDSIDVNDRWKIGLIKTFYGLPGSTPPVDSVNTMVALGSRQYGKFLWNTSTLAYDIADGVRVEWTDPLGVKWSTDRGAAGQSTSTFAITEVHSTGEPFGPRFTMKCTFDCVLYDEAGNSRTVSGGFLFGPVITS